MDYLQYGGTFENCFNKSPLKVLNLIINGLPSIQNIHNEMTVHADEHVLNLIIDGLPSIQYEIKGFRFKRNGVLNLIIDGLPSIWLAHPVQQTVLILKF